MQSNNRLLTSTTDPAGNTINYAYNSSNDLLTSVSASVGDQTVTNSYSYTNRRLTGITHNNFNYSFTYDGFGNVTSTSVGNQVLSSNTYLPNNGLLSTSTYGNGDSVSYTYDNLYRTTGKSYDGQTAFTYVYDAYGNLARTTDLVNNVTYTYQYDMVGRTTGMDSTQGQTLRVSYDDKNRTDYVVSKVGDTSTKTQYVYGETENGQKTGLIYGVKVDDQDAVSYTYDELARLSSRTLNIGHNNGLTTFYEYLDGNSVGMTTPLVSKISMGMTGWNYTYDSRGNIETIGWGIVISPNPFWHWRYYYDELNQLVREDNEQQNKTITYSYDVGGNITSRTEYPYTTGELGEPTATITYSYDDSNWKDKLTSYNGSLITYDEIGNPLIYHDGKQFTWQHGRQMASLHDEGLSVSYTYDDSGIRTSKTVNGTKTQYYLNGSTILTQITGDDRLDFFYDENGLLIGFSYNGEKYYYFRNLQNDIVSIYDGNGNQVVSYTYDSWGKLLSIEGSAKDTIGVLNPFRYRGYYYDTESGFYYLNSRYYDPAVGRYINADGFVSTNQGIGEHNMFAYCANNPIMRADPSGCLWEVAVAIGATVAILIGSVAAGIYGASYNEETQQVNSSKTISPTTSLLNVTVGKKTATTKTIAGNSSKTINFYATGRTDNVLASSAGISIKVYNYTFQLSLGGDNIGFSSTFTNNENIAHTSAIRINPLEWKAGLEFSVSETTQWDPETIRETQYTNISLDGKILAGYYLMALSGNSVPIESRVPSLAYAG